jgi:hypothetical protein
MTYFYVLGSGQVYSENTLQINTGFRPTTDPGVLASNGIYTVIETPVPPYNLGLYDITAVYTIDGFYADQSWTATPKVLPIAKENGTEEVQIAANLEVANIVTASGYSAEVLSAAGAMLEVDRPAVYQTVIAEQQVVTDNLAVQVEAIANATTVDEVNSVVTPPYGIFVSGRGGAGPLDMNPSYFSALNNLPPGIDEAQLEIYIPGTDTVIPYDPGLPPPYYFDSMGNCYTGTDYRTTFRIAATGQVLGTVTPAFGANVPIPWTYDPVIPAA